MVAGPPEFSVPKTVLQNLLEEDFCISDIAALLSVSERTVYRRTQEYNMRKEDFSDIDDSEVDERASELILEFPRCGETMLRQLLRQRGLKPVVMVLDGLRTVKSSPIFLRRAGQLNQPVGIKIQNSDFVNYGAEGVINENEEISEDNTRPFLSSLLSGHEECRK